MFKHLINTLAIVAANQLQQELCPNCGEFFPRLNDFTGFCTDCTASTANLAGTLTAAEVFLLRNADHIEHYLFKGKTLNQAIDSLRHELAKFRTCACCGAFIQRGSANVVFCRKNPKCKAVVRRYEYLHHKKGLTKAEALSEVLASINGSE